MLAALIAGERDPKLLAQMARAEMCGKITALQEAPRSTGVRKKPRRAPQMVS